MTASYVEIFCRLLRPIEPTATDAEPVLRELRGIRAVLFDVYGTLIVSGSGEVGTALLPVTARQAACEEALSGAFKAMGILASGDAGQRVQYLFRAIESSHEESRQRGVDCPEVDIVEMWRKTVAELVGRGLIGESAGREMDLRRLAVEYEVRANPCWPMPNAAECLEGLRERGITIGIVSNAQFYTPLLFEALLGKSPEQWGVEPDLELYSYRYGRAKPAAELYRRAAETLADRGITAQEALYVGNDMLNDVYPAQQAGFHTALFAGDARSLRRRSDEPRVAGIRPDLILTDLGEILRCIIS